MGILTDRYDVLMTGDPPSRQLTFKGYQGRSSEAPAHSHDARARRSVMEIDTGPLRLRRAGKDPLYVTQIARF